VGLFEDCSFVVERGLPGFALLAHVLVAKDGDHAPLYRQWEINTETTPATTPDDNRIEGVHRSLDSRNLLPSGQPVGKGDTDATVLAASQRNHGVEIPGQATQDPGWQSRAKAGFGISALAIDWEARALTCPSGKQSVSGYQRPIRHRARTSKYAFLCETASPDPLAPMHAIEAGAT
jgi:hypothetical protein